MARMPLVKMQDKSFNPIDISLLGINAVVRETKLAPYLIQQSHAIGLIFARTLWDVLKTCITLKSRVFQAWISGASNARRNISRHFGSTFNVRPCAPIRWTI
jgi:hypothetical protein